MGRSVSISESNIAELAGELGEFAALLPMAFQRAIRGAGGEALAAELRSREPSRTGTLRANTKVWTNGPGMALGAVLIGYRGAQVRTTPASGRLGNLGVSATEQRGAWYESGTQPHVITPRGPGHPLRLLDGTEVERVDHPGAPAHKIVPKAMRSAQWEVEAAVVDELRAIPGGVPL